MKVSGFIRVTTPDDYEFSLSSADAGRLTIGSKLVIDNDGDHHHTEEKQGTVHLDPGVHRFVIVYSHDTSGEQSFSFTFPKAFVRTLRKSDLAQRRIEADALLAMGKTDEAKAVLMKLARDSWPMNETAQIQLEAALRTVRRLANAEHTDTDEVMRTIDRWSDMYPMLRTITGFMIVRLELLGAMGDHARAYALAGQMRRMDMADSARRQLMLVQVKSRIKAGQMDAAREIYRELKETAPYSEETIEAREAIRETVLRE